MDTLKSLWVRYGSSPRANMPGAGSGSGSIGGF